MRYATGVLDAVGRFTCRIRDEQVTEASVEATVPRQIGDELVRILGGTYFGGVWRLPPDDHADVLSRIMPLMADKGQIDTARAVVAFRLTQPARRIGWRTSTPVKEWRLQAAKVGLKSRQSRRK